MHPARLWKPLSDDRVQCRLCSHFCVLNEGGVGRCGVRQNIAGKLMTLVYDRIASCSLDPIEKKPLYHFQPGSKTLSFATMGCNFRCSFCQNASLSQPPAEGDPVRGQLASPESLVEAALESGASSIAYTYSEPTVFFELMLDTAKLAVEAGLKNVMVSNGFMSRECLDALGPYMHAANIDLKAFTEKFYEELCGASLKPVLNSLRRIRELGWWLEVTTLLIPGRNDSSEELRELATFISDELGESTPWHISRFHPQYKMENLPPTGMEALAVAHEIGKAAGLKYVYLGNVGLPEYSRTMCPECGIAVIDRTGFTLGMKRIRNGGCEFCDAAIAGIDLG